MKQLANVITISRIVISFMLLSTQPFSLPFILLYAYCGLSDMADGLIARKLNATSKFGSRLDSISDIIFVAVCLIKILPVLQLESWVWMWIAGIAVIKVTNLIFGYRCCKELVFLHTAANKATGFMLFLFPLAIQWAPTEISAAFICAVATFAAIQEGHFIRTGRLENL